MLAHCDSCPAQFDVTGKRPGAVFKCPRCGEGKIEVPADEADADALEELPAMTEESPDPGADAEESAAAASPRSSASRGRAAGGPASGGRAAGGRAAGGRAAGGRAGARSAGARTAGARAGRTREPAARKGLGPGAIAGIAAAVLAVAVGGYLLTRDEGAGDGGGSTGSTSSSAANAPGKPERSPSEVYRERLAALADADAAARSDLAIYCLENGLKDEATALHRDAILIDPALKASREALGFARYDGPARQYQGRWLDAADLALAKTAERFVTGDDLSRSETPEMRFMKNADALKATMLGEFPEDDWLYAYGSDMMPIPFMVLIERTKSADVDAYRAQYAESLSTLKEAFYDRYQDRFKLEEITSPIRAVVFDSLPTYNKHRGNFPDKGYSDPAFILGYYIPSQKQVMMWRLGKGDDWGANVLFHEGTHMFVHYAFSGPTFEDSNQSPWFQEGFAEYFGGYKKVKEGGKTTFKLGMFLPGRYGQYRNLDFRGQLLTLQSLVRMSQAQFLDARGKQYDEDSRALVENVYAQGWALVMYMNYAHGGKYKAAWDDYFEEETNGGGNWANFARLMGIDGQDEDAWQDLEDDFREWANKELPKINRTEGG